MNWPHQQFVQGRAKNGSTGQRYKNYVRALKNAENHLVSQGTITAKPSYLMECLVWNVPDATLKTGTLDDGFRATLVWLWQHLNEQYVREDWEEPNRPQVPVRRWAEVVPHGRQGRGVADVGAVGLLR